MIRIAAIAAMTLFATSALADGDAAEGEGTFAKRCKTCHSISNAGEDIVKGGKTGPNLYGVIGRQAGSTDFKYGDSAKAAGEKGLGWDRAQIIAYLEDPKAFLVEYLGDPKARSKMAFKLKDEGDRADIAAYLATFSATN